MTEPANRRPVSDDLMLGRFVLGRYRVIDILAQGGMGVVYLGRTEGAAGFSRPVVIKRVLPQLLGDPSIGKMFVREARILANLRHPGIVGVIDFGEEDEAYLMVLEYVHGYDAAQWLYYLRQAKRRVPEDVALRIAVQVLEALHYAHTLKRPDGTALQVIHRDISPGNILLDTEGHVRLSDFGIARIANEAAEYKTQETTFKGKLGYAHPALLARGEPSPQTDVYSVAVVLFQLLGGANPFRGSSAAETINRVVNLPTPRLREVLPDVPEELDDVVFKGMNREPSCAYPDAQSFAEALRRLMTRSDTDVASEMALLLTRDFHDLPLISGRPGLEDRESAWRRSIPGPSPGLSSTPPIATFSEPVTVVESGGATLAGELTVADATRPVAPEARHSAVAGGRRTATVIAVAALALAGAALALVWKDAPPASEARYVVISKDETQTATEATSTDAKGHTEAPVEAESAQTTAPAPLDSAPATAESKAQGGVPTGKARKPDPKYFTRVFSQRQGAVQRCFEGADGDSDEVNLQIVFRVDTSGRVTDASLVPASLGGTSAGRCVLGVARGVGFGALTESATFRIPVQARRR